MDVLLTFVGTRDPRWKSPNAEDEQDGPILSLLSKRPFDHVVLFCSAGTKKRAAAAKQVLVESYDYKERQIDVKELLLPDPTDYVAILAGLRQHIPELVQAHADGQFFFAGSSGTPQMQAAAMLLVMSGFIGANFLLTREPQFEGAPVREFDFTEPEFPRVSFWSREFEAERITESDLMQEANALGIVGDHPKLKAAIQLAEDYAKYDCTVLLLGETGTGKELFAKFIRERSKRKKRPYIKVNCAELPEATAESELFGHERGAFTGASQLKLGLMEAAEGGILFLDELPHLRREVQAKLLRAADQKTIKRMGGTREIKVDVRLIFGTNKDLRKMESEGQFLPDLRYRIGQSRITIPPLRERKTDIPALANHFLKGFEQKTGEAFRLTDSAISMLLHRSWPGNVRELEKLIEDSCMRAHGPFLDTMDLRIDSEEVPLKQPPTLPYPCEGFSLEDFEKDVRFQCMRRALELANGNKSKAARLLGMTPQAFSNYLKTHPEIINQN